MISFIAAILGGSLWRKALGLAGRFAFRFGFGAYDPAKLASAGISIVLAVLLGAVAAIGVWAWNSPGGSSKAEQCRQACDASRLAAENAALKSALQIAKQAQQAQARAIEELEADVEYKRSENEELRAKAPDRDDLVFAADDPWVLAKQGAAAKSRPDRARRGGDGADNVRR